MFIPTFEHHQGIYLKIYMYNMNVLCKTRLIHGTKIILTEQMCFSEQCVYDLSRTATGCTKQFLPQTFKIFKHYFKYVVDKRIMYKY